MELDKIITGDSAIVLQSFPPDCIDLTVTSPPYDNLRAEAYQSVFDFETIARQLFRVTKAGGVVVWVVGDATVNGSETGTSFRQALYFMECGFKLHDTMIYDKNGFRFPFPNRYHQVFEYMFVFVKGDLQKFNPLMDKPRVWGDNHKGGHAKRESDGSMTMRKGHTSKAGEPTMRFNIWRYSGAKAQSDDKTAKHPAVFPEALARDHILSWSNEGDIVLDCFAGSGTTLKKAKELSRHYIGIEREPKYVSIAEKRLLATSVPLFGQGRGLTQREPDKRDSSPSQAFTQPEFLSDLEGLS